MVALMMGGAGLRSAQAGSWLSVVFHDAGDRGKLPAAAGLVYLGGTPPYGGHQTHVLWPDLRSHCFAGIISRFVLVVRVGAMSLGFGSARSRAPARVMSEPIAPDHHVA